MYNINIISNEKFESSNNITLRIYSRHNKQLYYTIDIILPIINIPNEIMNKIRWMIPHKKINVSKIHYKHKNKINYIINGKRSKIYDSYINYKSKINDITTADIELSKYTKQILNILYDANSINNETFFTFTYYAFSKDCKRVMNTGTFIYSDLLK